MLSIGIIRNSSVVGYLDLPTDIKMSISITSPWFSYSDSYSLPVTLPVTANNLELLKYPNYITQTGFKSENFNVYVNYCSKIERGTLSILSYSSEGIEISVLLGLSSLKNSLRESTLADVMGNEVLFDRSNIENEEARTIELIKDVCSSYHGYSSVLAWFPVSIDGIILNEPLNWDSPDPSVIFTERNLLPPKTIYHNIKQEIEDDVIITYPKGYFFTPFVKIWYVVKKIVEFAGYTISNEDNCFYDSEAYGHLCLLNNNVDSCMGDGKLYTRHLVPDMGAVEFLEEMKTLFGASVFILGNSAKIVFSRNYTQSKGDWSSKVGGYPQISFGKDSKVSLKLDKVTAESDYVDTETESIQELEKKFAKYNITETEPTVETPGAAIGGHYFFRIVEPFGFYTSPQVSSKFYLTAFVSYIPDAKNNIELSTKLQGYECVRRQLEPIHGYAPVSHLLIMPYIGGGNNIKMNFSYTPSGGEAKDATLNRDCPFMLAYDRGKYSDYSEYDTAFGGPSLYRNSDDYLPADICKPISEVKDLLKPLSPYCLVDNHTIPDNGHTITVKMNLTIPELISEDMMNPVVINGKVYYIQQMRFEASANGLNIVDFTFKTKA